MKIFKKQNLAFSIKPFGAAGKNYLGLAAMAFFDLTAPAEPLTEQDMWKAVPAELGPTPILDAGMPKIRGEVLAAGAAHAPRGQKVKGLAARIRVGQVEKTLNVFGERYWLPDGAISEAREFISQPITYENAFGGPDFPQNPKGKGIAQIALPDGRKAVPLPNVEAPRRMIGAPEDRPEPAGFGPLDVTLPQRAKYNGTYDARWKSERWPGLPDDTDFLLFNCAPKDQWIAEFFRGDEPFEVENMHPDMPVVRGALPGLRARMFLTMIENYKLYADPAGFRESFVEVPTRLETVWLFPNILRGVAIYRGSVENRDDECRDVVRVFLEWERLGERAGTLEEYAEKQKKAMDRKVAVNMAPFQAAGKKMGAAVKQVKNAPKTLARIKAAATGQTPTMPVSPEEIAAMARQTAAGNLATIDKLEAVARDLHGKFGHLAAIDLTRFDKLRETVKTALGKAESAAGRVGAALKKANAKKAAAISEANAAMDKAPSAADMAARGVDINELRKLGYNPDFRFSDKDETGVPFHDAGFPFAVACRRSLAANPEAQDALRRLGLPDAVVKRAWLGLNPEAKSEDGAAWGLPKTPDGGQAEAIELPAGLVFPRFDGPALNRLMIRPGAMQGDYASPDADVLVKGSDETPLALPPAEPGGHYVRVADELQALFMEEEIGDACGVVALPDPGAKPDPETAKAIAATDAFAVILPAGTNPLGEEWAAWKGAYKNAVYVILPKGRTVFESRKAGADLRALVMEVLPKDFAKMHAIEPELPEAGQAPGASPYPPVRFPDLGIGQAVGDGIAQAQKAAEPIKAELLAMKQKSEDALAEEAAKHGKTLSEIQAAAAADSGKSPAERGAEPLQKLIQEKERMRDFKALTPELEAKFDESIARTKAIIDKAESQYQAGMTRIEASKGTFADAKKQFAAKTIPGMSAEDMRKAGIDPEMARPMTRPEVVERYNAGLSFARRNLTGLDLSELNLAGIDLSEAILKKTSFAGCVLDGAKFNKAIAAEANFSKASLKEADLSMGLFMGAKLRKADLSGANLKQTVLQKANLEKADLSEAKLRMAIIQDANLCKARFGEANLSLSVIDRTKLDKADFRRAVMNKTVFRDLAMDRTDFSGAALHSVLLQGVAGRKLSFLEADMHKFRIGKKCKLAGTDFRKANLKEACLRESDISGSDFRGADLSGAMIELCDAKGANFNRVSAKRSSIIKTDLAGADMYGLNLFKGSLRKSRLTAANLGRSNLYAVDFYKCVVGKTIFDGANLKRTFLDKVEGALR